MRKRIAGVAFVAAAMMAAAAPSWAFTGGATVTSTATVTVGGTAVANFTLDLRDASNPLVDTNPDHITWGTVTAGVTTWNIANQVLLLNATVTDSGGGIQIYTDNRATNAAPKYIGPNGTNPAGLVASNGLSTLSLGWSIKASTLNVVNTVIAGAQPATEIHPDDPNATTHPDSFQWFFFLDRFTGDPTVNPPGKLTDGQQYAEMINVQGIQFSQGGSFGTTPDGANTYVYLQANFASAAAQATYGSNKIIVQAFTS